jgi:ribonuclease Z
VKQHPEIQAHIETSRFTIEGSSRAGRETWFLIRELSIGLDIGRCPEPLYRLGSIFVTHTHLDHAAGIPFYGNQRRLLRLGTGRVYLPAEAADDYRELMRVHERLEDSEYPIEIIGLAEGDVVPLSGDRSVRVHRSSHRVPTNAYEVIADHGGHVQSLLYYTGDTDRQILVREDAAIFKSDVVIMECSFIAPGDEERAGRYRHIHADEIFEHAERFQCSTLLLTHFSLRYSPAQIRDLISKRAPERLRGRIRLALPEPFSHL